ncbi:hypothetical protein KAI87_04150, partial [Myxococcota bacterium]|nr:hypothetical protein [Myxococcota bacterium]
LDFSELSFAAYYAPSQWVLGEMIYPRASLSLLGGWFSLQGTYDVHSNTYFAPGLGGELGVRIVPFVHRGFFIDLSVGYSWRKSSMVRVRDQDEEDDDPIYSPLVSLGEVDLSAWNGSFRGGYAF